MWCFYVMLFFKQKTAYEMRISDWSSDVCSSDLVESARDELHRPETLGHEANLGREFLHIRAVIGRADGRRGDDRSKRGRRGTKIGDIGLGDVRVDQRGVFRIARPSAPRPRPEIIIGRPTGNTTIHHGPEHDAIAIPFPHIALYKIAL